MKSLPRQQGGILWTELWSQLQSEWFKVEVLQDYTGEDAGESLTAWMAGDKQRSIALIKSEPHDWSDSCRKKTETGITLTRIRVIDYHLSEYVKWEIEVYKHRNIPYGKEDIYLIDRANIKHLPIPSGDIMIFDKSYVVANTYNGFGYMVSQVFYDNSDDISPYLELRDELLAAKLQKVK